MNLWQSFFNIPRAQLRSSAAPGVTDPSQAAKCNLNTLVAGKLCGLKLQCLSYLSLITFFKAVEIICVIIWRLRDAQQGKVVGEMTESREFLPSIPFPVCCPSTCSPCPSSGMNPWEDQCPVLGFSPPSAPGIAAGAEQSVGRGWSSGLHTQSPSPARGKCPPRNSQRELFPPFPLLPPQSLHPRACNLLFSLLKFKLVILEHLWSRLMTHSSCTAPSWQSTELGPHLGDEFLPT